MPIVLPRNFRFSHQFCFDLHDILAQIVVDFEEHQLTNVAFALKNKEDAAEFATIEAGAVWTWLESHGYDEELDDLTCRQVFVALLSDLCHFLYEALSASIKGKLAVAYSLLRKPLKDNLFYLEWLLADRKHFLKTFRTGKIANVEYTTAFQTEAAKRTIIRGAMRCTRNVESICDEWLYQVRYDKAAAYGFEGHWNQAVHLITTAHHYRTDDCNFNFVFSDVNDHVAQWEHIYSQLPFVLMHVVGVAESLLGTFTSIEENAAEWRWFRRSVGLLIWSTIAHQPFGAGSPLDAFRQHLESYGDLCCGECHQTIKFTLRRAIRFYRQGIVNCHSCGAITDVEEPATVSVEADAEADLRTSFQVEQTGPP